MRRQRPSQVNMRKIKNPKFQTINGFVVANDNLEDMGGRFDDYTMGNFDISSLWSTTTSNLTNVANSFITSEAQKLQQKLLPQSQTTNTTIIQEKQPDQTSIQNIQTPMPQWLKYTLFGLGGVASLLLLITLTRMAMNAGKKA